MMNFMKMIQCQSNNNIGPTAPLICSFITTKNHVYSGGFNMTIINNRHKCLYYMTL